MGFLDELWMGSLDELSMGCLDTLSMGCLAIGSKCDRGALSTRGPQHPIAAAKTIWVGG